MFARLFDQDPNAITLPAQHQIFQVGDPGEQLYVVTEGTVDIEINGKVVETVGPGGLFGEMALIEELPRNARAVTTAAAKIVPVDRRRFMFLVQQNPFFALQLMQVMAGRLRRMDAAL